jgi:hypothetical protein
MLNVNFNNVRILALKVFTSIHEEMASIVNPKRPTLGHSVLQFVQYNSERSWFRIGGGGKCTSADIRIHGYIKSRKID